MTCIYCSNPIPDDALCCPVCGADIAAGYSEPADADYDAYDANGYVPDYAYDAPYIDARLYDDEYRALSDRILLLGILALVLSLFGIPGIVLGAVVYIPVRRYESLYVRLDGKAKVGYILAQFGLFLGVSMTVAWAVTLTFNGLLYALFRMISNAVMTS